jgi:ethanolamine-phosphate cytidylyltransferase
MSSGECWVYADAVCDLFHLGHVEFFRQARALGDRLVIGLLSDADASSYKPAPILSFAERLAVVRACRHVDRVIEEPVPLVPTAAFLDSIGADFLVHGDDMSEDVLAKYYRDLMDRGRLRTVRYTAHISSRQIVERVIKRWQDGSLRR